MKKSVLNLMALLGALTMLCVAACDPGDRGDAASTKKVMWPSPNGVSAYDPTVDTSGDKRPTAPSTNDLSPDQINGGGNSGIVVPVAPMGGAVSGGHR